MFLSKKERSTVRRERFEIIKRFQRIWAIYRVIQTWCFGCLTHALTSAWAHLRSHPFVVLFIIILNFILIFFIFIQQRKRKDKEKKGKKRKKRGKKEMKKMKER